MLADQCVVHELVSLQVCTTCNDGDVCQEIPLHGHQRQKSHACECTASLQHDCIKVGQDCHLVNHVGCVKICALCKLAIAPFWLETSYAFQCRFELFFWYQKEQNIHIFPLATRSCLTSSTLASVLQHLSVLTQLLLWARSKLNRTMVRRQLLTYNLI